MQIIYGIGIFMITSSFIMVSFVWLMNLKIKQSDYSEIPQENIDFSEHTQLSQNTKAA